MNNMTTIEGDGHIQSTLAAILNVYLVENIRKIKAGQFL
jgi:hypothetical protein